MQPEQTEALLFDFDGVIVNTFDASFEINQINNPLLTKKDYLSHFEGNIYEAMKNNDTVYRPNTVSNFFNHYNQRLLNHSLDDEVAKAVKSLANNFIMFIVSSSSDSGIRGYLAKHNLEKCFVEIFATEAGFSKTEKITTIFKTYQLPQAKCLFITDTLGDVKEASKAGVESIGVTWGYHPIETLRKGNPYAIIESPAALPKAIDAYFEKIKSEDGKA
ncbi:MAG: HAD family hydrolase [Candidatus Magasanikbacteria bacterium]|nr:HAD family hydrolase [Candidatus Magasanikbacteria bacterium]